MWIRRRKNRHAMRQLVSYVLLAFYLFATSATNLFHTCTHGGNLRHNVFNHGILQNDTECDVHWQHKTICEYRGAVHQQNHDGTMCAACLFLAVSKTTVPLAILIEYAVLAVAHNPFGETAVAHEYILSGLQTRAPPTTIS